MSIPINSNLTPRTSGYALMEDLDLEGGYRTVPSHVERDAIPEANRKAGMAVYTLTDSLLWILDADLVTWQEYSSAALAEVGLYYWNSSKTWAQLWAEVVAGGGFGTILIDNTTSTRTITAAEGPYDFTGIVFRTLSQVGPGLISSINFESGTLIDAGAYVAFRAAGPNTRFRPLAALMTPGANKQVVLELGEGITFGNSALNVTIFDTSYNGFGSNYVVIDGSLVTVGNSSNPLFYLNSATGSLRIFYKGLGANAVGYSAFNGLVAGGLSGSTVSYYSNPFTAGIFKTSSIASPCAVGTKATNSLFLPNYSAALSSPSSDNKGEFYWNTTSNQPQISDGTSYLDLVAVSQSSVQTSNYSAKKNELVRVNPTGGVFSITLPAASGHKSWIIVKNQSNSTNAVTILPTGSDTVDGASSGTINTSRAFGTYVSDGTSDWMAI